jgi:hypothetical protein
MDERIEVPSGGVELESKGILPEPNTIEQGIVFEQQTEQKSEKKVDELLKKIDTHTASLKAATQDEVGDDAKHLSLVDESERVEKLLALADTKGVIHAVSVARKLEDFYALDMFRDTLIENLHEKLDQQVGS